MAKGGNVEEATNDGVHLEKSNIEPLYWIPQPIRKLNTPSSEESNEKMGEGERYNDDDN